MRAPIIAFAMLCSCTYPEPYEVPQLPPRAVLVCDWDDAGAPDCRLVEVIEI